MVTQNMEELRTRKVVIKKLEIVGGYCYFWGKYGEGVVLELKSVGQMDESRTMASLTETDIIEEK